MTGEQRIIG